MNEKIKVGLIRKAHGLKGEVKLLPLTDDPKRFKNLKKLFLTTSNNENTFLEEHKIEWIKFPPGEIILKMKDINDKDAADSLRGTFLYIDRNDGILLKEWEFYTQDLVGLSVFYEEKNIGKIVDVLNTGANDNLEILLNDSSKNIYYPFLRDFIDNVDLKEGKLFINQYEGFLD